MARVTVYSARLPHNNAKRPAAVGNGGRRFLVQYGGILVKRIGLLLLALMMPACGQSSIEQALRPQQPTVVNGSSQPKKQGLVVTDNPYTISSERLEQMNKGGFGGY
jgi:hypothetical protein